MKDATYVKLLEMCAKQGGISMGRLLNNIVDKAVEGEEEVFKIACHVCGEDPIWKCFDKEKNVMLLCQEHFLKEKNDLTGWRAL